MVDNLNTRTKTMGKKMDKFNINLYPREVRGPCTQSHLETTFLLDDLAAATFLILFWLCNSQKEIYIFGLTSSLIYSSIVQQS